MRLLNQKLDWNGVLAMASAYDAEQAETDISVDRDAEAAEVWATTSAPLVLMLEKGVDRLHQLPLLVLFEEVKVGRMV